MAIELAITYLGLKLKSPVIVGSCPLTVIPESVRQLVVAGAGAIVLPSLLQEQIVRETMSSGAPLGTTERSGYQPQHDRYNGGVENYLQSIREFKEAYSVPIIGSLNGASIGDWLEYGKRMQDHGADAVELNWQSIVSAPSESSEMIESRFYACVRKLRSLVSIPISVKLGQRFTNLASVAHKLKDAGADGLTLFSHSPRWDVSIDRRHWTIRWELSPIDSVGEILEGIVRARTGGLEMSIAASGGIRTGEDAIKVMIAGADVVMITSEIYRQGPDAVSKIISGVSHYLDACHFGSLADFLQTRPAVKSNLPQVMRRELIDPLTSTETYYDPTPVATRGACDSFGHQLS
jgi:dihydroorotate dehydrogenase (fumarate)